MSRFVILGLSITSSWGNGHATTYRALVAALVARGHDVLFLERDQPWYADNRDLPRPPWGRTGLYRSRADLRRRWRGSIARADLVVVGSYVPEGAAVADWVLEAARGPVAFYDIDTPVTLERLAREDCEYLRAEQIARYALYLSFTGGPVLRHLETRYGSPRAAALYCSADPSLHRPARRACRFDLGYLGTYSADRQETLDELLLAPAAAWKEGRFAVAGPQFPASVRWPANVRRWEHLSPEHHRAFFAAQRYTLNVTRAAMRTWGWSPSVRLFEAAACGVPVISDAWPGLEEFFEPGREILVARSSEDVLAMVRGLSEDERRSIGQRARSRLLAEHTADHRAAALERELAAAGGATAAARVARREPPSRPGVATAPSQRASLGAAVETERATSRARTTVDHARIRAWIEAHGGRPAIRRPSAAADEAERGSPALAIDFGGPAGDLQRVSWKRFFDQFEARRLAFLTRETGTNGVAGRPFEFVERA